MQSFGPMIQRILCKISSALNRQILFMGKWPGKAQTFIMLDIMTHYGKQCGSAGPVNFSSCVNIIVDPVYLLLVICVL